MGKIASTDAKAMNHLFKVEAARQGIKVAAAAGEDPQAFADHKEYIDTVDSVLKEDKGQSWAPNDPILD